MTRLLSHVVLWALLLGAFAPRLAAQLREPPREVVRNIVVTNVGPQNVSEFLVRANIRVRVGEPYNKPSVDDDVRNLNATGFFAAIRVLEVRGDDGITLIYELIAKPKITDIQFTGNKKFSATKLGKKLTTKLGDPLDERKLFADAQEIKKLYEKSGYPRTDVKYVQNVQQSLGRGTVTFDVTENPKVTITDIYFEGAAAFPQKTLRKKLKTKRRWMCSWLTGSANLKEDQLEDDKDRLVEFYRNEGYVDFDIKEVKFLYDTPKKLRLVFVIYEGRKYRVGEVGFRGNALFPSNDILRGVVVEGKTKKPEMTVGKIFTPKGLNKDTDAVRDFYGNKGYIDTAIIPRKNANTQSGTMDLRYDIEEGDKSFIEKIEIRGNTRTKDRVIRRELSVAPGEVFDMASVRLSKLRLEGLNYFDRVEATPEPTDVPNRKNLVIFVSEKNTGSFTIGAGFSSVDSILGFVEVNQGNFDLFNPPLFRGGGQKARLRASVGTRRQDYLITFIEPWFLEKKLQFQLDLYHRDLNNVSINDIYRERRTGARVGLTRALGSDFIIGGVNYTIESVGILDVDPAASQVIRDEAGTTLVSKVGAFLAYDTRNSTTLPNRGQRTELATYVAGGPFGGDADFYKWELKSAHYIKGPFEDHILEISAHTGVVDYYDNSTRVPLFDRWFLGGLYDLRGYRYRQVGPRDASGEPIGGSTYWFGSLEYSIPVVERVRFAVFYDVGMVYRDRYHWNFNNYNDNYGFGLRINIPQLGPLRLDYGIPIKSDPANRSNGRFQFGVGFTREF